MTPLEVRPLPGVGAEILGVDLASITVGDWTQLFASFASFGLLVFREQILTEVEYVEFAERWGEIEQDPSAQPQGVWHADQSFRSVPPLGSIEIARRVPTDGAVVRFASATNAFAALSTSTKRALEALSATHSAPGVGSCVHPMVIHHPVSGDKTLFINPTFTQSVEDMDEREGLALLNQLYEHCQLPEFTTSIEWELGTVLLWDHRAVWHFSEYGADSPTIRRVTIAGTAPRPAIDPQQKTPTLTERAGATLAGGILTAAMTGLAEVIDPERVKQDIEIVSEAPEREPLSDLDFGELPPLD